MVAAPFRFVEAGVAAECTPVCDCADKRVLGGTGGEVSNVVKHAVRDRLVTFRNCFVFLIALIIILI